MKFHLDGYVLRPGGAAYAKTVTFNDKHRTRHTGGAITVTIVRSPGGKLLRVERRRKP